MTTPSTLVAMSEKCDKYLQHDCKLEVLEQDFLTDNRSMVARVRCKSKNVQERHAG